MTTFEYVGIGVNADGSILFDGTGGTATDSTQAFNDAGAAGWELVAQVGMPAEVFGQFAVLSTFKRPTGTI